MRESELQRMCAQLLDAMGILWCHPPNGAYLNGKGRAGRQLKLQGMKPGVPDIVIFTPAPLNNRISFVELKTATGRLSHSQKVWRTKIEAFAYNYALARSLNDLIYYLDAWGYPAVPMSAPPVLHPRLL